MNAKKNTLDVSTKSTTKSAAKKYTEYRNKYSSSDFNNNEIAILANSYMDESGVENKKEYEGKQNVITTSEQGHVTWGVEVEKPGLYAIGIDYYPLKGYGSNIERNLLIDGAIPFREAEGVQFTRVYSDEQLNPSGNKIRSNQVETPKWVSSYVTDSLGYFGEAMYFYLDKGTHTISLESIKEPMAIANIKLISKDINPKPYQKVLEEKKATGAIEVSGKLEDGTLIVQAENTYEKSDPTLYAVSDNTSTKTQPYNSKTKLMNAIGGNAWKNSNQWMSWKITVPQSGFYNMGTRSKQNFVRDIYCNRTLYIDGKIPFEEASNLHFEYNDQWNVQKFGGENPYLFYLEKGEHTISLKVTAGDLQSILTEADYILGNLNSINLDLLALLSITPDVNRDYQIGRYMPETVTAIGENAARLQSIYDDLVSRTGKKDTLTSQLEQLISLLNKMHDSPDKIASSYSRYRELVGSFGKWIMTVREHPILLDYVFISEPGAKINKKEDGFFTKFYSGLLSVVYSFSNDTTKLSDQTVSTGKQKPITVWIGSGLTGGRDQAMALNQMIQQSFSAQTGIPVDLQLVPEETILMATLAGRGPDVALKVKMTEPVDFALRNAVYDLSKFSDYKNIEERFFSSATDPFEYNNGVYALPETMSFPMLFYRTDILEQLGIDVSQLKTWDSILEILPVLQAKNMNFALPATMEMYSMFLYQMGEEYYTKNSQASNLSSQKALDAFEFWTNFYSVYSLPIDFSFENRFRTGEMPIGIAEYTTYNLLSISAPEIKGKWAMIQLPGMKDNNNNITNVSPITTQGCILMNSSKDKDAAWEFMKWWTSADSQYEFGKQLEAVMGAAARYNTANKEALQRMPWTAADRIGLMAQAGNIHGIPQIPGGYFTERNLNFAKLNVINKAASPRETLADYSAKITEEITMKRKEFGLDYIK
jgi:ABC-type glycerol-3-phosphate transport system substrate-binding protein